MNDETYSLDKLATRWYLRDLFERIPTFECYFIDGSFPKSNNLVTMDDMQLQRIGRRSSHDEKKIPNSI